MTVRLEIYGPPASGKTRLADAIRARLPMLREAGDCYLVANRHVYTYSGSKGDVTAALSALGQEYVVVIGNTITVSVVHKTEDE